MATSRSKALIRYLHKMPLRCQELPVEIVAALSAKIKKLPLTHPLHKESLDGDLTIFTHNGYAIFHSAAGFYFRHIHDNLESEINAEISGSRGYLCSAFEIDTADQTVVHQLRDRFQENHGYKMARMIEHHIIPWNGKQLMLVKFPSCVIRHMLASSGGFLKTGFTGKRENLAKIPILVKLGQVPSGEGSDIVNSVIITEYKMEQYMAAMRIHNDILKEVMAHPHLGITLGPIAQWDS